jgi:hypothetical protein
MKDAQNDCVKGNKPNVNGKNPSEINADNLNNIRLEAKQKFRNNRRII